MAEPHSDTTTVDAALAWHDAGCSVIPVRADGSKAPSGPWTAYMTTPADPATIRGWFADGQLGIGIVCGAVSGGLEMLELEGRAIQAGALDDLADLVRSAGLGALWERLVTGYSECSPSGGLHLLYRVAGAPVPGNAKLARDSSRECLAETRGEGGYVIVAPTPGHVHSTGNPWVALSGTPATIPTLTVDEREALHSVVRLLDQTTPAAVTAPAPPVVPAQTGGAVSPGDDYEAQTSWTDILGPHGWTVSFRRGDTTYWTRPGKTSGVSATTGNSAQRDRLYVFSTSTVFAAETSYTKFGAYAVLEHGGDHKAAAKALADAGYGERSNVIELRPWQPSVMGSTPSHPVPSPSQADEQGNTDSDDYTPSWRPVDLSDILAGTYEPAQTRYMPREDGACLLYPGLIHSMHGESESGKSLVVQAEVARLINAGQPCCYVDYESDAPSVVGRLIELGADPAAIAEHFTYVHPEVDPRRGGALEALAWVELLARQYALAVIDGVTDALGTFGASSKDNDEVSAWLRALPRTIAKRTGAAVVLIDHVTKDADTRGRFAIGGQAKMAGLDGAAYVVEVVDALGRGLRGVVTLRVAKDRPGSVRARCGPFRKTDRTQEAARVVVDSTGEADRIVVTFQAPHQAPHDGEGGKTAFRPTALMQKVSEYLAVHGTVALGELRRAIPGKATWVDGAVTALIVEGYAQESPGPRGARLISLLKDYEETTDPASDRYMPPLKPFGGETL